MSVWSYEGKRVIVSGCFSGMGEAAARELVRLGAEVHGMDYRPSTVEMASFTDMDLRDPKSIDAAVRKVGGKVDALFNCAGLPQTSPPVEVMQANFIGPRHLAEQVLPLMSRGGAIAGISSNAGLGWSQRIETNMALALSPDYAAAMAWCEANPDTVAEGYTLSKEAVIVWTMLMGYRLVPQGIRINCIMPGPTQTPMMAHFERCVPMAILDAAMQPINRRSSAEEQAYPLIFLNSDAASYINGMWLPVDGGFFGSVSTGQIDMASMMRSAMPA